VQAYGKAGCEYIAARWCPQHRNAAADCKRKDADRMQYIWTDSALLMEGKMQHKHVSLRKEK
jgi:hypothetical protein